MSSLLLTATRGIVVIITGALGEHTGAVLLRILLTLWLQHEFFERLIGKIFVIIIGKSACALPSSRRRHNARDLWGAHSGAVCKWRW